ncbi:uncharacterized protein ACOB6Z_011757 [Ctenodactylus gundi]
MDKKPTVRRGPEFCSIRYGLALIMHFSNFTMITQRVSLSIAIIAMVNSTQHGPPNASAEGLLMDSLSHPSRPIKDFNTKASVYHWSPETQGIIFSSISYGIILTLIPSGYLAGIFGAKQMLGAGLLISSLLTLFTPLAADSGVILVIVVRTVQGMAQGMAWTGQFTIWAKWAPPLERSKLTSIAGSGAAFGSFIILCVGGLISQALGWPFIFYIFGSTGCVCCLLWFTVIYDDPTHHPCISVREKEHIISSLAQQSSSPRRSVPIRAMVRCLPLWAIFMGFFSHFWLCTIIITYLPTYISTVLHVNIRDSGVLSSLPFVAAASCTVLGGQLADFFLSKNLLSLIAVRKLFSFLGLLLPSLCAVALPFVASSYTTTVILLILIPGTSNLCDSGFIINTLDVAPRYASFLMGISRGFGLIAGIISSTTTGFLISQVGHVLAHLQVAVPTLCSIRYGVALMAHFLNFMLAAQNAILNITMVAMVNSTRHLSQYNGSSQGLPEALSSGTSEAPTSPPVKAPVYDWNSETQGILFSSLHYGMLLTQPVGGYLAGKMGAKRVAGVALLGSSLLTLCIPLAANLGLAFLLATRIVQGLLQGSGFGGHFALWRRWAPPHERSRLCSIGLSGMILGLFTVILLGGIISQALGWPFVFYVFGSLGCACGLLWFVLVYDDPTSHPWIGITEKEYILSTSDQKVCSEDRSLPIKDALRSLPLWSICLCSFSHQWLVNTMVVYTPTYISYMYHINIRDNGLLSSLPFLVAWLMGILGGLLADFLLTKNFRLVTVRKIFTIAGQLPPSAGLVAMPYVSSSYITAITLLIISCGLSSLCQAGIYINILDIAPRYASFLIGASRGLAHTSAVLVPIVSGFLLSQDPDFGWNNMFFLLFAINMLGLIFYVIFGEGDVQDWAKERKLTHL